MISIDPVCGGAIERDEAEASQLMATFRETTFHFCSEECKGKFALSPEIYAERARSLQWPNEDVEGEIDRAWE